jgi:hypothetical protein
VSLTSLPDLKAKVDAYAELCLPDFVFKHDKVEMVFYAADLEGEDHPSLAIRNPKIVNDDGQTPYLFTEWSRAQLLSRLGASEKWFRNVSLETQIDELNIRLHCLNDMMVRTIRSADEETVPFRAVRGMVSKLYTDLPDTFIINSLIKALGSGYVVKSLSGKTDRAFYAYVITKDEIEVPGTNFTAWPGLVIRNSEVGYSSLTVTLFLYFPAYRRPVLFKKHTLLKKIHRGKINELPTLFLDILEKSAGLWEGLEKKLDRLEMLVYKDEDAAVAALRFIIERVGGTKGFAENCVRAYKRVGKAVVNRKHNAAGLFQAVLTSTEHIREDSAFDEGRLAGALLLLLTS